LKFKRKFLVSGDTIKKCWNFRKECRKLSSFFLPCNPKSPYLRDESRCPFPINEPVEYLVSETEEGEWQCSCPQWKFRRQECKHIRKVRANPREYEVNSEWTSKTIETIKKVTK